MWSDSLVDGSPVRRDRGLPRRPPRGAGPRFRPGGSGPV